ncbi:hypothetical protein ONE63_008028 [Megalurothrips usitatus]|uniref:Uncharacterized protein n=1 Tax=Megalurothrips usitatus TaxID=439358 RepID=A0AAV7XX47_9NEOP|nr:hypothetical protein ONE63_008028 [Megalurothrips usitatus]
MTEHLPEFVRPMFGEHVLRQRPCLIPKGFYSFADQPMNWSFPKFPVLPYGHFRARFEIAHLKETLLCSYMEGRIIPQQKRYRS